MFQIYSEVMTVLSITYINREKVNLVGINDSGMWMRILELNKENLVIEGKTIKPFTVIKLYCYGLQENGRREDRVFISDDQRKLELIDVLSSCEQKILLDNHLDSSVKGIINNFRSIGLIKPRVNKLEFLWNSYSCGYEAGINFRDSVGDKYSFICIEPKWQDYWIDFIRREPTNIKSHLLKMQWTLNDNNTFFIVGFTNRFKELPGPFDGRWPLILGIHSLSK